MQRPRAPFHYAVPAFRSLWAADFVSAVFIKDTGTLLSPRGGKRAEISSGGLGVAGLQASEDRGQNANCGHQQQGEFQLFHHSSLLGELLL